MRQNTSFISEVETLNCQNGFVEWWWNDLYGECNAALSTVEKKISSPMSRMAVLSDSAVFLWINPHRAELSEAIWEETGSVFFDLKFPVSKIQNKYTNRYNAIVVVLFQ